MPTSNWVNQRVRPHHPTASISPPFCPFPLILNLSVHILARDYGYLSELGNTPCRARHRGGNVRGHSVILPSPLEGDSTANAAVPAHSDHPFAYTNCDLSWANLCLRRQVSHIRKILSSSSIITNTPAVQVFSHSPDIGLTMYRNLESNQDIRKYVTSPSRGNHRN